MIHLLVQIQWSQRFACAPRDSKYLVSLDGTDCPIQEQSPFNKKWYSHKLNWAGIRYEVVLCIRTGRIVWVAGGVPCGEWPDLKLARSLPRRDIPR